MFPVAQIEQLEHSEKTHEYAENRSVLPSEEKLEIVPKTSGTVRNSGPRQSSAMCLS